MLPKDDNQKFVRLLAQAIPDRQRDKAEILHLARQLVCSNDYVAEMSDPVVLRAIHLYRKCHPQHGKEPVQLPALIHFLRTRRGLQQVDVLEGRLAKIREILFSLGPINVMQLVQVKPWDILTMRVLAGIDPPWDAALPDAKESIDEDDQSAAIDTTTDHA